MSRRRRRIPGTPSDRWRREIATGGNPVGALADALAGVPARRGQVWLLGVHHDDGCPATPDGPMLVCTCEIVWLEARRAA